MEFSFRWISLSLFLSFSLFVLSIQNFIVEEINVANILRETVFLESLRLNDKLGGVFAFNSLMIIAYEYLISTKTRA